MEKCCNKETLRDYAQHDAHCEVWVSPSSNSAMGRWVVPSPLRGKKGYERHHCNCGLDALLVYEPEDMPVRVMTLNEFQSSIAPTYRPGNTACHGLGIAGEAGEVADIIKKTLYHDEPLPLITHPRREALRKELGDVLWYVAAVASDWGLSLNDVAQGNIDKLRERYPNGFVKGGGIREPTQQQFTVATNTTGANPMSEKD